MEIELTNLDTRASRWDVKRAIGGILHGNAFFNDRNSTGGPRRTNFQVVLNEGITKTRNNGTGVLTLPNPVIGDKFMKYVRAKGKGITLNGRGILFHKTQSQVNKYQAMILEITPYLEPDKEEQREVTLAKLDVQLHVDKVQFGIFYRGPNDPPTASRRFSSEYELSHSNRGAGLIWIEYSHKLIRIQLGDPMLEQDAYNIAVRFSNIRRYAFGVDWGSPFVCFELWTPPIFQREHFNRTLTGDDFKDNKGYRRRESSLNPIHAAIAPYAHHLRIILHHEKDLSEFSNLCQVAGLKPPFNANVEGQAVGFYSSRELHKIEEWFRTFDWLVAFQIEACLRNGLLRPDEILALKKQIEAICTRWQDPEIAADILRLFSDIFRNRTQSQTALDCLEIAKKKSTLTKKRLSPGTFLCHHITVTPSRILLEGPFITPSNRVIRKYPDYQTNFIRVDFRDEDHLQYRWERDVDGKSLLEERVGGILRNGLDLAGQHFEFLAYSNSALRTHSVWFVREFKHHTRPFINAQVIRNGLGDFTGVIKSPSKLAARMAQAFTATDPSVRITRDQWEEIPDLGEEPHLFTDGVGTISPQLSDMIWEALCEDRDDHYRQSVQPTAYQIRFLGFKGVVRVDAQLEGIKMRLRGSMNKFRVPQDEDEADIEIAKAFSKAGIAYLNRPLVMILEDRGVDKSHFVRLQEEAVKDILTAHDTIPQASQFFMEHHLGRSYSMVFILNGLSAIGIGTRHEKGQKHLLSDFFLDRLLTYAKNTVLREIKHRARIPVPRSYHLVGVADEGPAYIKEGKGRPEDICCLKEGQIYVCVQEFDEEPVYLKGSVSISRSPTVHPGDVQRVWAIGKPPAGKLCSFANLKNVVVLPSVGNRSLASCLGGGDLDGDEYEVIHEPTILPTKQEDPAAYTPVNTRKLDRESTIEDICDFVVEYISSDILGLLSDTHLVIADQSKYGVNDSRCMKLAELCSQAVDYPKNGVPVNLENVPRRLIPVKPDWKQADHKNVQDTDYYESTKALGELFRSITLIRKPKPLEDDIKDRPLLQQPPLSDTISKALIPYITKHLRGYINTDEAVSGIQGLFSIYVDELRYTRLAHSLSESPDSRLDEEEIVVGTILADCTQHRYRSDLIYRMRMHADMVVRSIRDKLYRPPPPKEPLDEGAALYGLSQAWLAWDFGMRNRANFGANSFSLIALATILDILQRFGEISTKNAPKVNASMRDRDAELEEADEIQWPE